MTPEDTPSTDRGSSLVIPLTLPFEYEDRTDLRHQRALQEIVAARAWSERRRARGLRPS